MLDNYRSEQQIIYETLSNSLKNDKISHAYLFDISNYDEGYNFIKAFIKSIICLNHKTNNIDCNHCNICKSIDENNYPDIEYVVPDGNWIKKEQLDKLQSNFSTKSLYNNKKIYVINGAEYLNVSSSNSILKFLEEPENNIIAILITKNINNILDTIKSRCQIYNFSTIEQKNISSIDKILSYIYNSKEERDKFKEQNNCEVLIEYILDFAVYLEKHKLKTIIHTYKLWFMNISDKKKNIVSLNVLILFYKDVINYKMNRRIEIFNQYEDQIKIVSNLNTFETLYKKINLIIVTKNKNNNNINLNLNMDNMIIEMEKIYD